MCLARLWISGSGQRCTVFTGWGKTERWPCGVYGWARRSEVMVALALILTVLASVLDTVRASPLLVAVLVTDF